MRTTNYYDILGIPHYAKPDDIRKAYLTLAKKYHPDKHRMSEAVASATEMFKKIQNAYETLSDHSARQAYDEKIKKPVHNNSFATANTTDHNATADEPFSPETDNNIAHYLKLSSAELGKLAKNSENAALFILANPQLLKKMGDDHLFDAALAHVSVAERIVYNKQFDAFLKKNNRFFELANKSLTLCLAILSNPYFHSSLTSQQLLFLAIKYDHNEGMLYCWQTIAKDPLVHNVDLVDFDDMIGRLIKKLFLQNRYSETSYYTIRFTSNFAMSNKIHSIIRQFKILGIFIEPSMLGRLTSKKFTDEEIDEITDWLNVKMNVFLENKTESYFQAVNNGNLDAIKFLIHNHDVDIDSVNSNNENALHVAIRNNDFHTVELLMQNRINKNAVNHLGETGLHLAAKNNYKEIVDYLLVKGANPNIPNHQGKIALHYAVKSNLAYWSDDLLSSYTRLDLDYVLPLFDSNKNNKQYDFLVNIKVKILDSIENEIKRLSTVPGQAGPIQYYQLCQVKKDINTTISSVVKHWFVNNTDRINDSEKMADFCKSLAKSLSCRMYELYKEPLIGKHPNLVGAFLKHLLGILIGVILLGVPLTASAYRNFFFNTQAEKMVNDMANLSNDYLAKNKTTWLR